MILKIGIFGASGHAREVADICLELGYEQIDFIEYEPKTDVDAFFGFSIVSESEVERLAVEGYHFAIGVGDNKLRKKIYEKFSHLNFVNLVHPSATLGFRQRDELMQHKGNVVLAGVRMTVNIKCGNFGVYNQNCTVAHDCVIEDFVTVAPGATVSGNVHLSKGVYIGTGASVIQGKSIEDKLVIGANSTVGAGSVVTKNIPENVIVKGVPAK